MQMTSYSVKRKTNGRMTYRLAPDQIFSRIPPGHSIWLHRTTKAMRKLSDCRKLSMQYHLNGQSFNNTVLIFCFIQYVTGFQQNLYTVVYQ